MSVPADKIIRRIEEPGIYNFRDLLDTCKTVPAQTETENQILNTLELFAFGGCSTYFRNREKFGEISAKAQEKLVQLSILSILNANVENDVGFSEILKAVDPFIKESPNLESVLISMVDAEIIKIRIHQENQSLRVVDTPVLRDAYNENTYNLRVLKTEDLMSLSVGSAKQILQKWLDQSIVPAQQDVGA